MTNIKDQISQAVSAHKDEIVEFVQSTVRAPSLVNDEGPVQELIADKIKSLVLDVEKVPIQFDQIKDPRVIKTLIKSHLMATSNAPIIEGVTNGTDLRLFTNQGKIPAVLYGPGDLIRAHAANEYVRIDDVLTTVKVIANLTVNWCGIIE